MLRSVRTLATVAFATAAVTTLAVEAANAEDVAEFYRGKTVRVIVPYSSGGMYSTFGLLLSRHLHEHIPGKPTTIAQHMPGAGGATAHGYVYNVAPKDGTVLLTPAAGIATQPLLQTGTVHYDPAKFNYLGAWGEALYTMTVFHTSPVKSFEQALKTEVIFGSTGTASLNYQLPLMAKSLLDAKITLITGYRGGGPVRLAMERGEVHGFSGNYLGWVSTRPDWLRDRKLIHLAQFGSKRASTLKDVPTLLEFAKTDAQRSVMNFVADAGLVAFTVAAAPDVPPARLDALESAITATLNDPKFRAEAEKLGFPVEPVSRKEVTAVVHRMTGTSESKLDAVRRALGYNKDK